MILAVGGGSVAYGMSLYGKAGEPVAQRALAQLVEDVQRRDPLIGVVLDSDGVGWASCELSSRRDPRVDLDRLKRDLMDPGVLERGPLPITVEVNIRPDVVPEAVRELLKLGGPAELAGCDVLVAIYLVGSLTDWPTVRVVWESAMGDVVGRAACGRLRVRHPGRPAMTGIGLPGCIAAPAAADARSAASRPSTSGEPLDEIGPTDCQLGNRRSSRGQAA